MKQALAEPLRGHKQIIKLLDPLQDTSWVSHCPGHVVMCDQAPSHETKKVKRDGVALRFWPPFKSQVHFCIPPQDTLIKVKDPER